MLAILNSYNAHNFPIVKPILMIHVFVLIFIFHSALSNRTYLLLGLLSHLSQGLFELIPKIMASNGDSVCFRYTYLVSIQKYIRNHRGTASVIFYANPHHHTGKCIRRFGGIYAYCRYFIYRKW